MDWRKWNSISSIFAVFFVFAVLSIAKTSPKYPEKPALLVELKYNQTVKTAADQIHDRNYPQKLYHYKGNILLVSVNYNKEVPSTDVKYKHHSCRIEKL